MIIFQGAKVNVICFWLIKPKFGKQGFSEFPSTVCGHLGEKRPKEQSKALGDISFGPPGLLNMFLSAPNTIVLKSSSCLFLDWQWSFCLDALSSAWWERGYHLCDQQKECYSWSGTCVFSTDQEKQLWGALSLSSVLTLLLPLQHSARWGVAVGRVPSYLDRRNEWNIYRWALQALCMFFFIPIFFYFHYYLWA